MKISDKVDEYYRDYYADGSVGLKREIAARQSVSHLRTLAQSTDRPFHSLIDVGAGDGAVLAEAEKQGIASELHAVEISESGCSAIRHRQLRTLRSLRSFDGYRVDAPDKHYSLGLAVHVLEHVEHERAFLNELGRISDSVYVEVPLELTARSGHAIRVSGPYGHINFYNPQTFQNILRTSGLQIVAFGVFTNSIEYEVLVGGPVKGRVKHALRSTLLKALPHFAPYAMAYVAGAMCRPVCRERP